MPSDWQSPSDPTVIPAPLVAALQAAHAVEAAAEGAGRRPAFRFTRGLLGGVLAAGYSARAVAACLGVAEASVKSRIERNAWLPEPRIRQIVGTRKLRRWQTTGLLTTERTEPSGETSYPAVDVVQATMTAKSRQQPSVRTSKITNSQTNPDT